MAMATVPKNMQKGSPGVNIMPPVVFFGCLIFGGVLEFIVPSNIPIRSNLTRIGLGLVISGCGFAFMMTAHETFKRLDTNIPTNLPATVFVSQGAYRISRNPMYVGGSAFFVGMGIAIGSLWMLAAYVPLGAYLSLYVIPREESYMRRTFGDDYVNYCRNVRRWL